VREEHFYLIRPPSVRNTMGAKSAWLSLLYSFSLLQGIRSQSVIDFTNYPANSRPCLISAATSSNCPTATVPQFNGCVCSNTGNFVTSAVQCLTSSDSADLAAVYGTMSSNCADSNTPLGFTLQQFLALAGGTSTTSTPNNPPATTTVTGVTTVSQQGTTKVQTFVTTVQPAKTTSSDVVTTIVVTPTGTSQTAPFTSVITLAGGSQSTSTAAPAGNGGNGGNSGSGSKLSTTAIIGMGVGIPVFLAIIGLIGTLCWCQRHRSRKREQQQPAPTPTMIVPGAAAVNPYVAGSHMSRPESAVTAYTNTAPVAAAYDYKAQQSRFSNMSYQKPSSPDYQSPDPRWSQQQSNPPNTYMAPQQTPSPPGQHPNWSQQPSPSPQGGPVYGAVPPNHMYQGVPHELPGGLYMQPQELPGQQEQGYGYNRSSK
jgi:hypothetical protein